MKTLDAPMLNLLLDPLGRILSPEVARKLVDYRFDWTISSYDSLVSSEIDAFLFDSAKTMYKKRREQWSKK